MSNDNCQNICVVCGEYETEDDTLTKCSEDSYNRMKFFAEAWSQYGRRCELHEKLSTENWIKDSVSYHRHCYDNLTRKNNLSNLKRRMDMNIISESKSQKILESNFCIICQKQRKEAASSVTLQRVAEQILGLKITASTTCLKNRLASFNNTDDIFKHNIKYHSVCLLNEGKKQHAT